MNRRSFLAALIAAGLSPLARLEALAAPSAGKVLSARQIQDLVAATLKDLGRLKFRVIASEMQVYVAHAKALRKLSMGRTA